MGKKAKPSGSQASGVRSSQFKFRPDEITIIGLDTKDGPEHPLYDPRIKNPLSERRVKSMMTFGVLQPILFQRDGDRVLVVDGRGRVRHAREADKRLRAAGGEGLLVPGLPKTGTAESLFAMSRVANAHRDQDGPLENAENANRMIALGHEIDDIAVVFDVTPATIKQWIALLGLDPKVRAAVESGRLRPSAAAPLAKLPRDQQVAQLEALQAAGAKPTAARVVNRLREANGAAPVVTAAGKLKLIATVLDEASALPDGGFFSDQEHLSHQIECVAKIRAIVEGK